MGAAEVQSRRAKRMLEKRLAEMRKQRHAEICLPVAKANMEALEDWAALPEGTLKEFKGAGEAGSFIKHHLAERSTKDAEFYSNTLPKAQVKQDEVVRELRRVSTKLSHLREESSRTKSSSAETAAVMASNALLDALPKLLKTCIDELASGGHGWKNGVPENWEKHEAALLCDLLPLANSSGLRESNTNPIVSLAEVDWGSAEAERHDAGELLQAMRDLEGISIRLSDYLGPQVSAIGTDSKMLTPSWSPATASTMEPSGKLASTSSTTPADLSSVPGPGAERGELQNLLRELEKEQETLNRQKRAKTLAGRLYKEQLQRITIDGSSAEQSLRESKDHFRQHCSEMSDLSLRAALEKRGNTLSWGVEGGPQRT